MCWVKQSWSQSAACLQRALLRQGAHEERLDLKRKNNQTFQQRVSLR